MGLSLESALWVCGQGSFWAFKAKDSTDPKTLLLCQEASGVRLHQPRRRPSQQRRHSPRPCGSVSRPHGPLISPSRRSSRTPSLRPAWTVLVHTHLPVSFLNPTRTVQSTAFNASCQYQLTLFSLAEFPILTINPLNMTHFVRGRRERENSGD